MQNGKTALFAINNPLTTKWLNMNSHGRKPVVHCQLGKQNPEGAQLYTPANYTSKLEALNTYNAI